MNSEAAQSVASSGLLEATPARSERVATPSSSDVLWEVAIA